MMYRAVLMPKAGVMTASPVGQWPIASQARVSALEPAARKIAPHTPPPALSAEFAALTMASTGTAAMSPWTTSTGCGELTAIALKVKQAARRSNARAPQADPSRY